MNETQLIEWKASWRDEYLQWLCGFANAQGGVLEVGRDDAGRVVGLANAARLMEELRLTEGRYLKRAALLLFHPDPERFVAGAAVKIGYFASEDDLRYHDEVCGPLFAQVNKTMDVLLTKYLKAGISYEGIHRVETYPMPRAALREAVLNAIVHRDYAVPAPIQIRVYADRLLIWNPGELPEGWSLDRLLGPHPSQPFNPDVANAFFRAGEIEAWGRGIERVFSACRVAGAPEPRIWVEPRDLWVEFPFSAAYLKTIAEGTSQKTAQEISETSQELPETSQKTSQERILALLCAEPTLTRTALAERIGITPSGIRYHLDRLRETGRLRRVGSTKRGHWEVVEIGEGT